MRHKRLVAATWQMLEQLTFIGKNRRKQQKRKKIRTPHKTLGKEEIVAS